MQYSTTKKTVISEIWAVEKISEPTKDTSSQQKVLHNVFNKKLPFLDSSDVGLPSISFSAAKQPDVPDCAYAQCVGRIYRLQSIMLVALVFLEKSTLCGFPGKYNVRYGTKCEFAKKNEGGKQLN